MIRWEGFRTGAVPRPSDRLRDPGVHTARRLRSRRRHPRHPRRDLPKPRVDRDRAVVGSQRDLLVLIGASLFGIFPMVYAIFLPPLYIPVVLLSFGLIFWGVASSAIAPRAYAGCRTGGSPPLSDCRLRAGPGDRDDSPGAAGRRRPGSRATPSSGSRRFRACAALAWCWSTPYSGHLAGPQDRWRHAGLGLSSGEVAACRRAQIPGSWRSCSPSPRTSGSLSAGSKCPGFSRVPGARGAGRLLPVVRGAGARAGCRTR